MSIIIERRMTRGWTQLPNDVLRDPNLSLKAKGLLAQLLSHEDGWQKSIAYCSRETKDGRDSVASALRELEAAGYVRREKRKATTGKWVWDHRVSDAPIYAETPSTENPYTVEPSTVNPSTEMASIGEEALGEDSLGEEHPDEDSNLAPIPSSRVPDLIFEELFFLETGEQYNPSSKDRLTGSARGALNKAAGEIRASGVTPLELAEAISMWPSLFPGATCTATAVAKHLPRLKAATRGLIARSNGGENAARMEAALDAKWKEMDAQDAAHLV